MVCMCSCITRCKAQRMGALTVVNASCATFFRRLTCHKRDAALLPDVPRRCVGPLSSRPLTRWARRAWFCRFCRFSRSTQAIPIYTSFDT